EVVNVCAIADDEGVRRPGLQLRDSLALHGQPDRETGADRAGDSLRWGGRAAAGRSEGCGNDCGEQPAGRSGDSGHVTCLPWVMSSQSNSGSDDRSSKARRVIRTVETPRAFGSGAAEATITDPGAPCPREEAAGG